VFSPDSFPIDVVLIMRMVFKPDNAVKNRAVSSAAWRWSNLAGEKGDRRYDRLYAMPDRSRLAGRISGAASNAGKAGFRRVPEPIKLCRPRKTPQNPYTKLWITPEQVP